MRISHRCRDGRWAPDGSRARLLRAGCGAVFAAVLVCAAAGAARAGDDDDNNNNQRMSSPSSFYDKVLKVIGVEGGADIQYSERSPLVVPPTRDLPPPQPDRPPAVADWPTDPDLTPAHVAKPKEKPGPVEDHAVMDAQPLRPDQLNVAGGTTRTSNAGGGPKGVSSSDYPEQEGRSKRSIFSLFRDAFKKEQYGVFTGEPARTSLTDPPPGYLTPSADQPYGVGPEEKKTKVPTVADRVNPVTGSQAGQ